jgi:hypothetical protein
MNRSIRSKREQEERHTTTTAGEQSNGPAEIETMRRSGSKLCFVASKIPTRHYRSQATGFTVGGSLAWEHVVERRRPRLTSSHYHISPWSKLAVVEIRINECFIHGKLHHNQSRVRQLQYGLTGTNTIRTQFVGLKGSSVLLLPLAFLHSLLAEVKNTKLGDLTTAPTVLTASQLLFLFHVSTQTPFLYCTVNHETCYSQITCRRDFRNETQQWL